MGQNSLLSIKADQAKPLANSSFSDFLGIKSYRPIPGESQGQPLQQSGFSYSGGTGDK
jgi:hypothetical protein